jgi:hypothetical protein
MYIYDQALSIGRATDVEQVFLLLSVIMWRIKWKFPIIIATLIFNPIKFRQKLRIYLLRLLDLEISNSSFVF